MAQYIISYEIVVFFNFKVIDPIIVLDVLDCFDCAVMNIGFAFR